MTPLMERLSSNFLPLFLGGMAVNFEIAVIAIAVGLAFGLLLAVGRLGGGMAGGAAASIISVMRAAPTFVVMFFLLNAIPRNAALFGVPLALSGVMAVALSLLPYAAAYIADSGVEALQQLRRGSPLGSLLFLPNVTRAFFVLVMSSSAGAAIGVPEGIAVILRQAEQLPSLGDKLALFAVGIVFFGIPLQAGFAVMTLFQRRLSRAVIRNRQVAAAPRG
jgi:ABC-type arginine/histidine transport system permease subunit